MKHALDIIKLLYSKSVHHTFNGTTYFLYRNKYKKQQYQLYIVTNPNPVFADMVVYQVILELLSVVIFIFKAFFWLCVMSWINYHNYKYNIVIKYNKTEK